MSRSVVYIAPDMVTTHIAAALARQMVALFGPSKPVKWGSWRGSWPVENPYTPVGSQRCGNVALLQGKGHVFLYGGRE